MKLSVIAKVQVTIGAPVGVQANPSLFQNSDSSIKRDMYILINLEMIFATMSVLFLLEGRNRVWVRTAVSCGQAGCFFFF